MHEKDANFLRRQAEQCIALSRATFDLTVAGRLRAMAEEFQAKAAQWEHEADDFHPQAYGSNGTQTAKSNRN